MFDNNRKIQNSTLNGSVMPTIECLFIYELCHSEMMKKKSTNHNQQIKNQYRT